MANEEEAGGQALGRTGALVDRPPPQGAAIGENADVGKASAHVPTALAGVIDCDPVCEHAMCSWVALNNLITNRLLQSYTHFDALLRAIWTTSATLHDPACGSQALTGGGA